MHSRPLNEIFTGSDSSSFRSAIVPMLMIAALSQLRFVTCLGSSCSQPTLAKRPSYKEGSGRNEISRPLTPDGAVNEETALFPAPPAFAVKAVPSTHPSCSDLRHPVAKSPLMYVFALATTTSCADACGLSSSVCSTSCAG